MLCAHKAPSDHLLSLRLRNALPPLAVAVSITVGGVNATCLCTNGTRLVLEGVYFANGTFEGVNTTFRAGEGVGAVAACPRLPPARVPAGAACLCLQSASLQQSLRHVDPGGCPLVAASALCTSQVDALLNPPLWACR